MTRKTTHRLGWRSVAIVALIATGLAGCGPAPRGSGINDPYEASNRKTHEFNKQVDSALFRASDDSSKSVGPIGHAVGNVGNNLGLPSKVLNSILQGRPEPAIKNTFRFLINSTVGLGGVFDPAGASLSLPESYTDFGETLHVWGVGEGTYLELPIIGPSTERDALGTVVDLLIDPLNALDPDPRLTAMAFRLGARVETRKQYSATVESVLYDSADSYAQSRLLYLQNRRFELNGEERNDAAAYDPYDDPALQ
ncbi:VacJ family lipoprotein [Thioclava sp.]|uniref:MlaA family lipoprotein n=1 Tax=Thioclava sp. TaxID=1933450 RepID=UPI003AA7D8B2